MALVPRPFVAVETLDCRLRPFLLGFSGSDKAYLSSAFLELQLTILTLSAWIVWAPLSSLKVTFRIRNVQTSSQNR
jgi:hypothetical protein